MPDIALHPVQMAFKSKIICADLAQDPVHDPCPKTVPHPTSDFSTGAKKNLKIYAYLGIIAFVLFGALRNGLVT